MIRNVILALAVFNLTACSGLRTTDQAFSAHAENFNILFIQIPGGDTQKRAMALVPQGAEVTTIASSPTDLTSVIGFINRLIGVDFTFINGSTTKPQ
jgi:hypothetical protein